MLLSMTGYGYGESTFELGVIQTEIRSVNHKFIDIHTKIPKELYLFEQDINRLLKKYFTRGRVDLFIKFQENESSNAKPNVKIESNLIEYVFNESECLRKKLGIKEPVSMDFLLKIPGALSFQADNAPNNKYENAWVYIETAVLTAISNIYSMKEIEGKQTRDVIDERLETIKKLISDIKTSIKLLSFDLEKKLKTRIDNILSIIKQNSSYEDLDKHRLLQEVAYLVDKSDISEELERIDSHIMQFFNVLNSEEKLSGRKLEFILQELFRESNTIGSKSIDISITQHNLLIKLELEKIREQIQNIE